MKNHDACAMIQNEMNTSALLIPALPPFPNSALPVLVYQGAQPAMGADFEALFLKNGWSGVWVNGVYQRHHFHATAHEALGCIRGSASLMLGGPEGVQVLIQAGDALLLPAGMGHKRLQASPDFLIVGAYPKGQSPDMQEGDEEAYMPLLSQSQKTPLPDSDPVLGKKGPVFDDWHAQKG